VSKRYLLWGKELSECEFISKSEEETKKLGRALGKVLPEGALLILKGDLGCGKTVLTKGIASELGIPEDEVSSPSFTLVHEYEKLVHSDLYRLGSGDLSDLGLDELLTDERIKVFEWGESLEGEEDAIVVECFDRGDYRVFKVKDPKGKICEKLKEILEERCQE
jgi:tRNA threonylcarbamoyladenosine biosynthesis protein TsaE